MSEENKVKGIFGITSETKSSNATPIRVAKKVEDSPMFPSGWEFPIGKLVRVKANPEFEKNDGSVSAILDFTFVDKEKRIFTHREWEIETGDAKFEDKVGYMQVRIKHIWVETLGKFPEEGIGTGAKDFKEFFNSVAQSFNAKTYTVGEGESAKQYKSYTRPDLFIKLTYYKKRLGFPLSPNFLERVEKGKPCKVLTINTVYDKLEPQTASNNIPGTSPMDASSSDELPTFDDDFS